MIEILKNFPDNVIAFSCEGQITKEDYGGILVPAILNALKRHDKIRLLYQTSANFTGYDPGALWEDLRSAWNIPRAGSGSLWSPTLTGLCKRSMLSAFLCLAR